MGGVFTAATYLVVLVAAVWAVAGAEASRSRQRLGVVAFAVGVIGVPSLLQLTVLPGLLGHLQRDRDQILAGQVWRLVTALAVQDGGWPGTVFNLVFLLVLGVAASRVWNGWQWLLVALASGIGAELWGLHVQPVGAGNSVVNFGLAGSQAVVAVRGGTRVARAQAAVSLLGALVLLVIGDIHGGAAAVGAAVGVLLHRRQTPATVGS